MGPEVAFFRIVDGQPVVNAAAVRQADVDAERTRKFLNANYEQFLKQHSDQWIAVFREQVVAVAPALDDLFAQVEGQGFRRGSVMVEFLDANPTPQIVSVLR